MNDFSESLGNRFCLRSLRKHDLLREDEAAHNRSDTAHGRAEQIQDDDQSEAAVQLAGALAQGGDNQYEYQHRCDCLQSADEHVAEDPDGGSILCKNSENSTDNQADDDADDQTGVVIHPHNGF